MRKIFIYLIISLFVNNLAYSQNRPTAADNTVSTDEDVDKVFTQSDFNYNDADGDPFYKVRITSNVSQGTLYFDDNLNGIVDAGETISSGDEVLTDDFNKFKFKPDPDEFGSSYTSFDFKVHDGNDGYSWSSYTMTIDVNPVNDDPVVSTNTGITVDEGSSGNTISQSNLETTDIDNTASELTYTISTAPSHGTLYRNSTALSNGSTFTQEDINNNRISYDHDGSETTDDSFTFDVDDGNGGSTGSTVFTITINPQNDPPVLTTNTGKTVDEGSTDNIILQSELEATDPDNSASELTYTVTVLPTNGELKLSGSSLSAGSTFTQADINSNSLTYDHDGSETTSDYFKFTVSDGNGGNISETQFDITISPVNDDPVVNTNTGMTVDEGSTGNTILQSYLETTDNDNTASELTYTISTAPSHGTLYRNSTALSNGSTFTQEDINNNRISYDHDGSETTDDSFTFDVDDGNGGSTGSTVFTITINPQNDPPVLTTNTGKTVDEGSTDNIILQSELEATDPDNSASELTYTVTVLPTNGELKLSGSSLSAGSTFTQADINSNSLTYDHDGSETTSDYFKFTVSDGNGGNISETQFDITISPVNDDPVVNTNTGMTVDEGSTGNTILQSYLETTDNDNTASELTYTISTAPSHGTLYRNSTALSNGSTFTQEDINNNRISYDHDGSETTDDSFTFDVDDGNGGSTGSTVFTITINPQNDPPVLTTNTGKTVDEGSTGNIILQSELEATDPDNAPSELTYTLTVEPTNGVLKRGSNVLSVGNSFMQSDINSNNISYDHDGSETTSDYFKFTVSDGNGGNIPETQFDITITSVNDLPEFTSTPITSADEGIPYTYDITTHDNDDPGTSLTITAPTIPSWLSLTDNGDGTAVLSGTPPHGVSRNNPVTLRVTDPSGDYTEQSFVIIVSLNIIVPNDYPTIQQGIDAAQDGDIVEVQPGTYTENINFNGKNIELIGNETDPSQVIIDGNNNGPVVVIENGENATISGFTIQNGSGQIGLTSSSTVHAPASGYYGGGILIYESSPTLKNLIIQNNNLQTNNNHGGSGAGIYIYHSNVSVIGDVSTVRIENNNSQVYRGGGICIDMASNVQLQNVRISNNHAGNYGGGIAVYDSQLDLTNVQILNNYVDGKNGLGGGIYSHNATVNQNSGVSISGNSATVSGNDIYLYP